LEAAGKPSAILLRGDLDYELAVFRVIPREHRRHIDRIKAGSYRDACRGVPNQLIARVYREEHLSLGVESELAAAGAGMRKIPNYSSGRGIGRYGVRSQNIHQYHSKGIASAF